MTDEKSLVLAIEPDLENFKIRVGKVKLEPIFCFPFIKETHVYLKDKVLSGNKIKLLRPDGTRLDSSFTMNMKEYQNAVVKYLKAGFNRQFQAVSYKTFIEPMLDQARRYCIFNHKYREFYFDPQLVSAMNRLRPLVMDMESDGEHGLIPLLLSMCRCENHKKTISREQFIQSINPDLASALKATTVKGARRAVEFIENGKFTNITNTKELALTIEAFLSYPAWQQDLINIVMKVSKPSLDKVDPVLQQRHYRAYFMAISRHAKIQKLHSKEYKSSVSGYCSAFWYVFHRYDGYNDYVSMLLEAETKEALLKMLPAHKARAVDQFLQGTTITFPYNPIERECAINWDDDDSRCELDCLIAIMGCDEPVNLGATFKWARGVEDDLDGLVAKNQKCTLTANAITCLGVDSFNLYLMSGDAPHASKPFTLTNPFSELNNSFVRLLNGGNLVIFNARIEPSDDSEAGTYYLLFEWKETVGRYVEAGMLDKQNLIFKNYSDWRPAIVSLLMQFNALAAQIRKGAPSEC